MSAPTDRRRFAAARAAALLPGSYNRTGRFDAAAWRRRAYPAVLVVLAWPALLWGLRCGPAHFPAKDLVTGPPGRFAAVLPPGHGWAGGPSPGGVLLVGWTDADRAAWRRAAAAGRWTRMPPAAVPGVQTDFIPGDPAAEDPAAARLLWVDARWLLGVWALWTVAAAGWWYRGKFRPPRD